MFKDYRSAKEWFDEKSLIEQIDHLFIGRGFHRYEEMNQFTIQSGMDGEVELEITNYRCGDEWGATVVRDLEQDIITDVSSFWIEEPTWSNDSYDDDEFDINHHHPIHLYNRAYVMPEVVRYSLFSGN